MTDNLEGQMNWLDQDTWFGKMFQEHSVQESPKEQTSKSPSRKSSASSAKMLPLCLCLKRDNGTKPDTSMEWVTMESPFPWLTNSMTLNITECHRDEEGLLWLPISMGLQPEKLYLTLNIGEKPRMEKPTCLSDVLEEEVDPKYNLSSKACSGILRRSANRGKPLPEILRKALEEQIDE